MSVKLCSDGGGDGGQLPDSKVSLCDEDNNPESKVRICEDECADLAPLTLQGSITPSNGSEYQAGGGKPPYIYSVTGGANMANDGATGVIGGLANGCGLGTVSVVDACGNRASMFFRYPTGQWVEVDSETCPWGSATTSFNCFSEDGRYKYTGTYNLFVVSSCMLPAECRDDEDTDTWYFKIKTTHEWQCP